MAAIHATGAGVRHAIARALATANLAPSDATFRVKRCRVDLDRDGDVARADLSLDLLEPAPVDPAQPDEAWGVVNPDGHHPLMAWLPGSAVAGVDPFYMDILAVSWARWLERNDGTVPPGVDPLCPVVGVELGQARAFAQAEGKRLPTALEFGAAWGPHALPWGEGADPSCGRVGRPRYDKLYEGGMHPPTHSGLFDLGAWLWQWLDDGRVAGGGPAEPSLAVPPDDRWPVGIRLVQDA